MLDIIARLKTSTFGMWAFHEIRTICHIPHLGHPLRESLYIIAIILNTSQSHVVHKTTDIK